MKTTVTLGFCSATLTSLSKSTISPVIFWKRHANLIRPKQRAIFTSGWRKKSLVIPKGQSRTSQQHGKMAFPMKMFFDDLSGRPTSPGSTTKQRVRNLHRSQRKKEAVRRSGRNQYAFHSIFSMILRRRDNLQKRQCKNFPTQMPPKICSPGHFSKRMSWKRQSVFSVRF